MTDETENCNSWEGCVDVYRLKVRLSDGTEFHRDFLKDFEAKGYAKKFLPNSALKEKYDIIPRTDDPEYLIVNPNMIVYVKVDLVTLSCTVTEHKALDDEGNEVSVYGYSEPVSVGRYTFSGEE